MMSSTMTVYVLTINGGVTPNRIAMLKEVCGVE